MLTVLIAYDVLGLFLGIIWVFAVPSTFAGTSAPPSWMRDSRRFVAYGLLIASIGVLVGSLFFRSHFASMRFCVHALSCQLAPLMLARGMWHLVRRDGVRSFGAALVVGALLVEGTYLYAREIEPYWLEVTEYHYVTPRLNGMERPIKVVVLADLQTNVIGDYERDVFRRVDALRADLILLPGDYLQFIDENVQQREQVRLDLVALFNGLEHRPRYGIWGVNGDVDRAAETFAGSVAQPIESELVTLPGDPPLQLWGLSRAESRQALPDWGRRKIEEFEGLTLVMGHAPDFLVPDLAALERADASAPLPALCVAGHIHGGQVVIPGIGPPVTLSRLPRRYVSGLHRFGALGLMVSRGVGCERGYAPRLRFNCRPELAVIFLEAESP